MAVWLGFFAGFEFRGLWFGLLAAQGSCALTMLVCLVRTDWDCQARRAEELTRTIPIEEEKVEKTGEHTVV